MGREQYSSPEAEAIGRIETAVDDLDTVVQELKNTDIANLSTEVANLEFSNENIVHVNAISLDVTGAGSLLYVGYTPTNTTSANSRFIDSLKVNTVEKLAFGIRITGYDANEGMAGDALQLPIKFDTRIQVTCDGAVNYIYKLD